MFFILRRHFIPKIFLSPKGKHEGSPPCRETLVNAFRVLFFLFFLQLREKVWANWNYPQFFVEIFHFHVSRRSFFLPEIFSLIFFFGLEWRWLFLNTGMPFSRPRGKIRAKWIPPLFHSSLGNNNGRVKFSSFSVKISKGPVYFPLKILPWRCSISVKGNIKDWTPPRHHISCIFLWNIHFSRFFFRFAMRFFLPALFSWWVLVSSGWGRAFFFLNVRFFSGRTGILIFFVVVVVFLLESVARVPRRRRFFYRSIQMNWGRFDWLRCEKETRSVIGWPPTTVLERIDGLERLFFDHLSASEWMRRVFIFSTQRRSIVKKKIGILSAVMKKKTNLSLEFVQIDCIFKYISTEMCWWWKEWWINGSSSATAYEMVSIKGRHRRWCKYF